MNRSITFSTVKLLLSHQHPVRHYRTSFQYHNYSNPNNQLEILKQQKVNENFQNKLKQGPDFQHFIQNSTLNQSKLDPFIMKWDKNLNEPYIDKESLNGKNAKGLEFKIWFND